MNSIRTFGTVLLGMCLIGNSSRGQTSDPNLVPWPQKIQIESGRLELHAGSRIVATDSRLKSLATVLAGEIEACFGWKAELADKPHAGDIVLKINSSLKGETHEVKVTDMATVCGGNYQAVAEGTVTLLQAMAAGADGKLSMPKLTIRDEPMHTYRGVMIDVARRNNSINSLKQCVVMCRLYKIRYMQIHLTDDHAWTFPSTAFPKLGSSNNGYDGLAPKVYKLEDLKDLVRFADARGVTLIPEIDVPGHTDALRIPYPEIFDANDGSAHLGLVDMTNPRAYEGIATLIGELCAVFTSSPYIHFGADEPRLDRCSVSPGYEKFMKEKGLKDSTDLYCHFIIEMDKIVKKNGRRSIAWGDFPAAGSASRKAPKDLTVICWQNGSGASRDFAALGYDVVNATWNPLYVVNQKRANLNKPDDGKTPPEKIYNWNPLIFDTVTLQPTNKVIGAQMCAWEEGGEIQIPALRSRVPVMSERIWNTGAGREWSDFSRRLAATDQLLTRLIACLPVLDDGN